MLNFFKKAGAALLLGAATLSTASATPILDIQNGKLMGASNVLIDAVYSTNGAHTLLVRAGYYDVKFVDGKVTDVYKSGFTPAGSGAEIAPGPWALYATMALSQVFTGVYSEQPALTNGCTSVNYCGALTIWSKQTASQLPPGTTPSYVGRIYYNYGTLYGGRDGFATYSVLPTIDFSQDQFRTFAVWTFREFVPDATSVPEPGTPVLLGLGLAALMIWRRRAVK